MKYFHFFFNKLVFHFGQDKGHRSQFPRNSLGICQYTYSEVTYFFRSLLDGMNVRGAARMSDNTSMLITSLNF